MSGDKQLFGQTLKTTMLTNYRLAMAEEGQEGAFNMLWSVFEATYLDTKQDIKDYQNFSDIDKSVIIDGSPQKSAFGSNFGFMRMGEEYTPTNSADPIGNDGDICHDRDYVYMKSSGTWKRSPVFTTF